MRRWWLTGMVIVALALVTTPVWAQEGRDRDRPPERREGVEKTEAELREINARIGQLERELTALMAKEDTPRERIQQVTNQLNELRAKRDRLQAQLREGRPDRPPAGAPAEKRPEGLERAEQLERQIRELNQVLEKRMGQLKDLAASVGEGDERVKAEQREIQTIRARRDALLAELKALEARGREGEVRREGERREGERREGEVRREG